MFRYLFPCFARLSQLIALSFTSTVFFFLELIVDCPENSISLGVAVSVRSFRFLLFLYFFFPRDARRVLRALVWARTAG